MSLRIVGLDPSLTATGIAWSGADPGCLTVGQSGITTLPLPLRVDAIEGLVRDIYRAAGAADLYLIEAQVTYAMKAATSAGQLERGALWWLLYRRLMRAGASVAVVNPTLIKRYATGKGACPKTAVVDAVARRLPMFPTGGDNNMADAAVLCAMGCDWLGRPLALMPAAHRDALPKVNWPAEYVVPGVADAGPTLVEVATNLDPLF